MHAHPPTPEAAWSLTCQLGPGLPAPVLGHAVVLVGREAMAARRREPPAPAWHRCRWPGPARPAARKWTWAAHPPPGRAAPAGAPSWPPCPRAPAQRPAQSLQCSLWGQTTRPRCGSPLGPMPPLRFGPFQPGHGVRRHNCTLRGPWGSEGGAGLAVTGWDCRATMIDGLFQQEPGNGEGAGQAQW